MNHHTKLLAAILFFLPCLSNSDSQKIAYFNTLIPAKIELRNRILTTVCCRDCDTLPKIENAGKIGLENSISYQLMHNGIKIYTDCYYGHWMSVLIGLLHGHHEPQEEKAFHELLKYIPDNSIMIEVGSYWGYYSLWFQQKIPRARNFLIEPDPKNLVIGQKNFILNNMHGHFTQATLGKESLENQIFTDWDYTKHTVSQISIDDFAAIHDLPFIHILHSDIQGAEVAMLQGCKKLIEERRIGYFVISTHRGTHEPCLEFLQQANLTIMLSITREESFSADGLIVAKLPELPGPENFEISRRTEQFCVLIEKVTEQ